MTIAMQSLVHCAATITNNSGLSCNSEVKFRKLLENLEQVLPQHYKHFFSSSSCCSSSNGSDSCCVVVVVVIVVVVAVVVVVVVVALFFFVNRVI